jgi:hypothetical protein
MTQHFQVQLRCVQGLSLFFHNYHVLLGAKESGHLIFILIFIHIYAYICICVYINIYYLISGMSVISLSIKMFYIQ